MQSRLPSWLAQSIDAQLHGVSGKTLAAEYGRMSENYRLGRPSNPSADPSLFWLAYLVGRMPATFAAVQAALRQLPSALMSECSSMLDLGSGPGTAIWAAMDFLPGLKDVHAMEHNAEAISLAAILAQAAPFQPSFERAELPAAIASAPEADLVMLAYAAGEMGTVVLEQAFAKARKLLLVVEPGTPAGYKIILEARKRLTGLFAPCPQTGPCPLADNADSKWCHFSARLERTKMARLLKGGDLGYEDEKFSYAAFSKSSTSPSAGGRLIGRPKILEKQVRLEICSEDGIVLQNITKANKVSFKAAKKLAWGDSWEPK